MATNGKKVVSQNSSNLKTYSYQFMGLKLDWTIKVDTPMALEATLDIIEAFKAEISADLQKLRENRAKLRANRK